MNTITYDPATKKMLLDPNRNLASGATCKTTITIEVKDKAGKPLAANKVWRFMGR